MIFIAGPVASALCHRWSCRTVVYIGSLLSLVGVFISAFAPNIIFLYFSYSVIAGNYCGCSFICFVVMYANSVIRLSSRLNDTLKH